MRYKEELVNKINFFENMLTKKEQRYIINI